MCHYYLFHANKKQAHIDDYDNYRDAYMRKMLSVQTIIMGTVTRKVT
jgi:hypothetical protein